jgi:hypothetical protein
MTKFKGCHSEECTEPGRRFSFHERCLLEWLKFSRDAKASKEVHIIENHADMDALAARRG